MTLLTNQCKQLNLTGRMRGLLVIRTMLSINSIASCPLLIHFTALLVLFSGQRLIAQENDQLRRRVLAEAPAAYRRFQEYCPQLQGTIDVTATTRFEDTGKTRKGGTYLEVKMNKDCAYWLGQSRNPAPDCEGSLNVVNPSYTFLLRRKNERAGWYLSELVGKGKESVLANISPARSSAEKLLLSAYKIYDLALVDILAEANDCKIQRMATIQKDGIELVQVDFDASHPVTGREGKPFSPTQGGMFLLDPSHKWCVVEYNIKAEYSGGTRTISSTCSYVSAPNGMPLPRISKLINRRTTIPRSTVEELTVFDFKEPSEPPGNDQFTLAAFGLPEPPIVANRSRGPIIVAIVGVCLLIAAFFVRRIAQARKG